MLFAPSYAESQEFQVPPVLTSSEIVLLPGLDGTGALFANLISALPQTLTVNIANYPTQRSLSYSELVPYVNEVIPSKSPFVLIAESFSAPLAVKLAATRPPNLAGLVLCTGFISSPAGNWTLLARVLARPLLFRFSPPGFVLKYFLIGADAPDALEAAVRQVLEMVNPKVLSDRIRAVLDCDSRKELALTEIPLMYIQAESDRLVGTECFRDIQMIRPDTVLASVSGPHLILQREPRKAAAAIMRFIYGLPGL